MAARIRVRMDPLVSAFASENQQLADGALVSLEVLGPFASDLKPGEPLAAKLSFELRYLESVRGSGEEEVAPLGTLEGELTRDPLDPELLSFKGQLGDDGRAVGLVPDEVIDEEAEASAPADPEDKSQIRVMRFLFDPEQFFDTNPLDTEPSEVLVRMEPERFRYCEVSVSLELAGAEEAPSTDNDVLDVLITARNPGRRLKVELRLTDLDGEPLPNARCRIVSGALPADEAADPSALTADGDGLIRLKTVLGAESFEIEWQAADQDLPLFRRKLFLDFSLDATEADRRRLNNVGYTQDSLRQQVLAFQADFGRETTGRLHDIRAELRAWHDDGVKPTVSSAA